MIIEGPPITRIDRLSFRGRTAWPAYVCVSHSYGQLPPHIHMPNSFAAWAVEEGDWMATDSASFGGRMHLLRTIWERPKV